MRWALCCLLVGCGFQVSVTDSGTDAVPDVADASIPGNWDVDPLSGKGAPASRMQWLDMLAHARLNIAAPDHLWLMQEPSGQLADSIGSIPLMPQASPSYANAVAGWTRRGVGVTETLGNAGFYTFSTGDLNGASYLLLAYVAVTVPTSTERSVLGVGGNGDHRYAVITTAPAYVAKGVSVAPSSASVNPGDVVRPVVLKVDVSRQEYTVYTDQDRLSTTWIPTSDQGPLVVFGGAIGHSASARYLLGAGWAGSAAECSDVAVKSLLQALGWTVTGY